MKEKFISIVDSLWHPSRKARDLLAKNGLYVLDMRSWDAGNGNSLETFAVVNYEGSVVVNFEITDWDYEKENDKEIFDMYGWLKKHPEVEDRYFDSEIQKRVEAILKASGMEEREWNKAA